VRQHALDAQCGQHDAGNDGEVPIGVGLDGQVDSGLASRLDESVFDRLVNPNKGVRKSHNMQTGGPIGGTQGSLQAAETP
jgi:hypothetical protein